MPETPDFDALARRIVELTDLGLVREQLILIWNARGAADVARLETELVPYGCQDRRPLREEPRPRAA